MSLRHLLPLVCLCVLVAPASAGAGAKRLDVKGDSPAFPVIVGSDVFYAAGSSSDGVEIRRFMGQADALVRSRPPAPEDDNETVNWFRSLAFEASAGVLVVEEYDSYSIKGAETVSRSSRDFGPIDGPAQPLDACGGLSDAEPAGNRVAITRCPGGNRRTDVIDVPTGATIRTIGNASLVDLEGDLIAYSQDGQVVVRNVVTNTELYRFAAPSGPGDLQADGKLALATRVVGGDPAQSCYTIAWYSAAEPTAHPFPGACVLPYRFRFEADRAVYSVNDSGSPVLMVSGLQGEARVVAGSVMGFDFDGARLVYACPASTRAAALVEDDLADPQSSAFCATLAPPAGRACHSTFGPVLDGVVSRCPVTISASRAKVDRRGVVTLRVKCLEGCEGTIRLRRKVGKRWKWITESVKLNIDDVQVRRYRIRLTAGRPPAGDGWKVEVVSKSFNTVSGSRSYVRTLRLVRG